MSSLFGLGGGGNVGASGSFYDYEIENSLRFDRASSARLMLDPIGSPTLTTKCTISFWFKRTTLGASQYLFTGEQSNLYYDHFQINPSDQLQIIGQENASSYGYRTNAVFRDVGAWYHCLLECDSTLSTGTDRYKLYVNNVRQTLTSIYGVHPQNHAWYWNKSSNSQNIGWSENYSNHYGGYMAEFNFIDGQALDPTSFGEEVNGVWVPKQYSGSYGTNGFYLPFVDSAAIGRDKAGSKTLVTSTSFSTIGGGTTNFTQSEADKGFDNDKSTNVDRTGTSGLIEITPTSSVTPVSHTMINAASGAYTAASRPNSVKLQGSNDGGSTWTDIDTLTNGSGANTETTSSFSNTTSYAKLRLNIASNHGGSNTRFAEYVVFASEDNGDGENIFFKKNLAASDVVLDSPTNNFATFNPLDLSGSIPSFFEGNLKVERSGNFAQAYSSFSFNSGKWYAEYLIDTGNADPGVIAGTQNPGSNRYLGQDSYTYGYYRDGRKINNGSYTSYGGSYTVAADGSGDVVGVYIDADNGDIYFSVNGTVQNSGTAAFTGVTGPFRFAADTENGGFVAVNFGQDDTFGGLKTSGSAAASDDNGNGVFYDAIALSGYLAPCTANLPEPAIGPNSTTTNDQNFNTVLYTGNASTNAITGVGHAPDFVWIKQRTSTNSHALSDSVRGQWKALSSNLTDSEYTYTNNGIQSFDSDGFTLVGSNGWFNASGSSYVSWNWKAGGTAVSNTDGSITSSVSANQDAGFSIVSYEGTGSNATVGHGLSSAPELIIIKERDNANGWAVSIKGDPTDFIRLDQTSAQSDDAAVFNDTAPTSTVFSIGTAAMVNRDSMIAYCFHSVEGYSKVGTYVGNGSTDGTFVYTGFRPAFILLKRSSASGTGWSILDATRNTFNAVDKILQPNVATAEQTSFPVDFCSNGFKWRTSDGTHNASATYIYLAFAESPFKYANAR